jgi:hypothetical protein
VDIAHERFLEFVAAGKIVGRERKNGRHAERTQVESRLRRGIAQTNVRKEMNPSTTIVGEFRKRNVHLGIRCELVMKTDIVRCIRERD